MFSLLSLSIRSFSPSIFHLSPIVVQTKVYHPTTFSISFSYSTMSSPSTYDTWSHEQLIQRIQELEQQTSLPCISSTTLTQSQSKETIPLRSSQSLMNLTPSFTNAPSSSSITQSELLKLQRRKKRLEKLETLPKRRIVLKLAYLGWHHEGFAAQTHTENTIEGHLFKALETSHFCTNIKEANYDRCGRTDKGVSAIGNVVALNLRSKASNEENPQEEYPYAMTLNQLLPPSIRILAWAYAPSPTFSSRYDCQSRTYSYLLPALGLKIEPIQEALLLLQGEHDFRHFCKIDPNKPERNYLRTIYKTSLTPLTYWNQPYFLIQLHGSAFLWRQIRFIMHLLTLIGMQFESPHLITQLFQVDHVIGKPVYPPASDLPLILTECTFEGIQWNYLDPVKCIWKSMMEEQTKTWILQFLFEKQCFPLTTTTTYSVDGIVAPIEKTHHWLQSMSGLSRSGYVPVLKRPQGDSVKLKASKLEKKLQQKSNVEENVAEKNVEGDTISTVC